MSHNISMKKAKILFDKELELRELQRQHKPLPTSRRQKKYEATRRRMNGRLWRIKDRILKTGGALPEHLKKLEGE